MQTPPVEAVWAAAAGAGGSWCWRPLLLGLGAAHGVRVLGGLLLIGKLALGSCDLRCTQAMLLCVGGLQPSVSQVLLVYFWCERTKRTAAQVCGWSTGSGRLRGCSVPSCRRACCLLRTAHWHYTLLLFVLVTFCLFVFQLNFPFLKN